MCKGSVGSIEIRKVVAVSLGCMGRSRMSVAFESKIGQWGPVWAGELYMADASDR